jgi:hypothetical protein
MTARRRMRRNPPGVISHDSRSGAAMSIKRAITLLKSAAVELNGAEGERALPFVTGALEQIWTDDRAMQRFYAMLERTHGMIDEHERV